MEYVGTRPKRYTNVTRPKYWKERTWPEKFFFWSDVKITQAVEVPYYEDAEYEEVLLHPVVPFGIGYPINKQ